MLRRKPWTLAAALAWVLLMTACTGAPTPSSTEVQLSPAGDWMPQLGSPTTIGAQGVVLDRPGVKVTVASGTVIEGQGMEVSTGEPVLAPTVRHESYGAPVRIDHDGALLKPVLLTWDIARLSAEQRAGIVLVRWDDSLKVWRSTDEPITVTDTTLSAEVQEFSILDWMSSQAATVSQVVGQWAGKRADAPHCSGRDLPSWVRDVVRPDETQAAMPIRTCVEPDKNGVLTVRVANNRPYTQALDLTKGDKYAWTWSGDADLTFAGIMRDSINRLMTNPKSLAMAPTRATAIGLARPPTAGEVKLELAARPTVATVGEDALVALVGSMVNLDDVKGFDSESLNAFVQAVYDCGGKNILKSRELVSADTFAKTLEIVKTCGDNDSVMAAIERVLRTQIEKGGDAAISAIRTNRILKGAIGKLAIYLTVSDFASYTAELASSGALGDIKVTIFGRGTPPVLGGWKASCTDPDRDSGQIYKNLMQQDAYAPSSVDPAKAPTWASDSSKAVRPLSTGMASHVQAVARNVESTWADKAAAAVVAAAIRKLVTNPPQGTAVELTRNGLGPFKFGAREKDVLPYLKSVFGKPKISGGVGGCEAAGFGYQSYATFGPLRVRFAAQDNSSKSPRTLGSWDVWLKSARQGRLALDQSIPFGLTLKQLKARYPDGGYFEYMGAWSAAGVLIVPDEPKKGTHMVHAGDLDWCI